MTPDLEQCGSCRHIFQNPRLTPAGLDFYYRDFYDGLGQELMEQVFDTGKQFYRGRVDMLKPFTTPKAWLDVGAGHGHFCRFARESWPDTVLDGLDQSVSVEEAHQRLRTEPETAVAGDRANPLAAGPVYRDAGRRPTVAGGRVRPR